MTSAHGRLKVRAGHSSSIPTMGVYVAIGSNVIIPRAGLWQRFRAEGWTYERFCAALDRLRDLGVIDVVTSIQKHRPTYDRLEIPLKD